MESLKVAILGSHFPPSGGGGVTSAHVNLYFALKNSGQQVKFFTFLDSNPPTEGEAHRFGAPMLVRYFIKALCKVFFFFADLFQFQFGARSYHTADILESFWGASGMNQQLKEFNPDVIIVPDHCCPALYLDKPANAKIIWVSHHNPKRFVDSNDLPKQSRLDTRFAVMLENQALKKVDFAVCPSAYMAAKFRETYRFSRPVFEAPNLLEVNRIASVEASGLRESLELSSSDLLIYIPSAGSPFKGSAFVPKIIDEFCSKVGNRKVGFYLSGPSPVEFKNALSSVHKNARLFFGGLIPNLEHLAHVKACDFGVSPTLLESFGMAVLEAQCLGVPMIVFDSDAVSEVVSPGKNGEIIDRGKWDVLVNKMLSYSEKRPQKSEYLGSELLKSQWNSGMRAWERVLAELAKR